MCVFSMYISNAKSFHSCPALCNSMDCSLPGSLVHGIFLAKILEWVAISSSLGSSQHGNWTHISCIPRWKVDSLPVSPLGSPQLLYVLCCAELLSCVWFFAQQRLQPARVLFPWGHSRQGYWSGLPCPPQVAIYILVNIFSFHIWTYLLDIWASLVAVVVMKNPFVNAGDMRCGFDPWVRKIPWRRAWQPTPVFLPGKSHGWGSLAGYHP